MAMRAASAAMHGCESSNNKHSDGYESSNDKRINDKCTMVMRAAMTPGNGYDSGNEKCINDKHGNGYESSNGDVQYQ